MCVCVCVCVCVCSVGVGRGVWWLLRLFASSKKQMSDGIRCTANAPGESTVKYQEEWEQRSVGRAFSPEAGEKPVRGEKNSEGHRGEWAEGP